MTRDRGIQIGLRRDEIEALPRLGRGNAGLEPAERAQPAKIPRRELARLRNELFPHQQGHPKIGHGDVDAAKVPRRDPKDRDRQAIQMDRASTHAAVSTKLALPKIMVEHGEWTGARRLA